MKKVAAKKNVVAVKEIVEIKKENKAKVIDKNIGHKIEIEGVTYDSKTQAIIRLTESGKTRSVIAKLMGIRYQFVNNVLTNVKNKA